MSAVFRNTFTAIIENIYCDYKKHLLRLKNTFTAL